jgi:hypothetical protein
MRINSAEFNRRIADVLDEIIPTMPVDGLTPALIARVKQSILKAAADEQLSYEALLAVALVEINTISQERTGV